MKVRLVIFLILSVTGEDTRHVQNVCHDTIHDGIEVAQYTEVLNKWEKANGLNSIVIVSKGKQHISRFLLDE